MVLLGFNELTALRSDQKGRYIADDIFECMLLNQILYFDFKLQWNSSYLGAEQAAGR